MEEEEKRDDKIEYRRGKEGGEERRWKWRGGDEKVRREDRSRVEIKEGKQRKEGRVGETGREKRGQISSRAKSGDRI